MFRFPVKMVYKSVRDWTSGEGSPYRICKNNPSPSTLFYYASHTQQKLVSRWGVGKHITLHYNKVRLHYSTIKYDIYMHLKRRGKFVFEIRQRLCGLCLIGKIVPEHCTTILEATLQKICVWPWKCYISLDIPKIVIYVGVIEFYK